MAKIGGPKTRCDEQWTEARFRSFIKGNLRRITSKWAPISNTQKEARVSRGIYLCNGCGEEVPNSLKDETGKRVKNVHVDHIKPIIDPKVGWVSWDDCIDRMFCERENLQVLCKACHDIKTEDEKQQAKQRRADEKELEFLREKHKQQQGKL